MNNEELNIISKILLVSICYICYAIIYIKIFKKIAKKYIDKPELILIIGYGTILGIFGGCIVINITETFITKILEI